MDKKLKKYLIIGATGLIGRAVSDALGGDSVWQGTTYPKPSNGLLKLDITNQREVRKVFLKTHPTHVIHCANLAGGVDFCQKNPEMAKKFHFNGTINLGAECLRHKSRFIFISSECVFDGKKVEYSEDDLHSPLNIYGKHKAMSEKWVINNMKNYAIARTMSVFGWDPDTKTPNALMNLFFSIIKKKQIEAPVFRWGNPTYVKDLASALVELAEFESSGIFHITGESFLNRYEWMLKACHVLGWDSSSIKPKIEPEEADMIRPMRVNLNTDKFKRIFTTRLSNLTEALNSIKYDIKEKTEYINV
ncbi:MAG: SDR family oxidoreductase [Candidatus Omnitrophota bacterium]